MSTGATLYPSYTGAKHHDFDLAFKTIGEAVIARRADFLLGAGMSADAGVPFGTPLTVAMLRDVLPELGKDPSNDAKLADLGDQLPFEALAEAVQQFHGGGDKGRSRLTKLLDSIFLKPNYSPTQCYSDFVSICNFGGSFSIVPRIFTTNFDSLLKGQLGDKGVLVTRKNLGDIQDAARSGKIPILCLHGRIEEGNYEITESQLMEAGFKPLQSSFRSALQEADAFVFVGYSMLDPDFRRLYLENREEIHLRKAQERHTYVVYPCDDEDLYSLGNKLWEARGAIWLPIGADKFFRRLLEIVEGEADAQMRTEIMKKYGLADVDAFNDLVDETSRLFRLDKESATRLLFEAWSPTGGVGR